MNRFDRLSPALGATVAAIGALGSVGAVFYAGGCDLAPSAEALLFWVWVASPCLCLAAANAYSSHFSTAPRRIVLVATIVVAVGGLSVYGNTLLRPQHSTSALIFIFLPLWSLLLVLVVTPIVAIAVAITRRRAPGA